MEIDVLPDVDCLEMIENNRLDDDPEYQFKCNRSAYFLEDEF